MSGDLVRHNGSSIDFAPQAWTLAQQIARTEFVPKDLRGRPEAVLASILTGHELGVGPMQALAKIHIVDGRPSIAAELMRALVLRQGHELWLEESSNTRCTVVARRSNSTRETRVTWTIDDADKANLKGKDNWRKYPRAMLMARATGEVCRMVFPDLLAGLSYTAEELTDGADVDFEDVRAAAATATDDPPKKKARAPRAATRPADSPADPTPAPPLPGEEDVEDAEVVDPAPAAAPYEGPDEHHDAKTYSGGQLIAMRCDALGISDRVNKLRLCGTIVGRQLLSSNELDADEVRKVLGVIGADGYRPPADLVTPRPRRRIAQPVAEGPAAGRRPEEWTGTEWMSFLDSRGVTHAALMEQAAILAGERDRPAPVSLDQLAGSGLADLLVGFCEDEHVGAGAG